MYVIIQSGNLSCRQAEVTQSANEQYHALHTDTHEMRLSLFILDLIILSSCFYALLSQ